MSEQNDKITSDTANSTVQDHTHKPTIGDKVSGKLEQVVGKITKNPDKIQEGESKKTGQPISSLPHSNDHHQHQHREKPDDVKEEDAVNEHVRKLHISNEAKHSHSHLKESPHLSPSERGSISPINSTHPPTSNRNSEDDLNKTKTPDSGTHHVHDSIHGKDIPPPPSSTNPNVIDDQTTATPVTPVRKQVQGKDIPLPPSHQNSFAYSNTYEPTTPDQKGELSSGYLAHGRLPPPSPIKPQSQGQGQTQGQRESGKEIGLGEGGVADRILIAPPAPPSGGVSGN